MGPEDVLRAHAVVGRDVLPTMAAMPIKAKIIRSSFPFITVTSMLTSV